MGQGAKRAATAIYWATAIEGTYMFGSFLRLPSSKLRGPIRNVRRLTSALVLSAKLCLRRFLRRRFFERQGGC